VITNNFNINIQFLNSRDFRKNVLYIGTEVVFFSSHLHIKNIMKMSVTFKEMLGTISF